jgi:multiple sugar transport system permease protein
MMSRSATTRRRRLSESQAALVLLFPFLAIYGLFLVYPFFKGIWISLHDWNLLAVAFNPDAKSFIGLDNYVRVMWGRDMAWGPLANPAWQIAGLVLLALSLLLRRMGVISAATALVLAIAAGLLFVLPGIHPGEGGRWYDRRFWPTVGNTLVFVAWTVPGVTISALLLAAALNRQSKVFAALRALFFLSQVLSVTVVTLIWQIMFSPRQGLIANITTLFGGSPITWLTDQQFAMAAIVITTIWWSLGIAMILFLAGLQNISKDLYEAASLDNARAASKPSGTSRCRTCIGRSPLW